MISLILFQEKGRRVFSKPRISLVTWAAACHFIESLFTDHSPRVPLIGNTSDLCTPPPPHPCREEVLTRVAWGPGRLLEGLACEHATVRVCAHVCVRMGVYTCKYTHMVLPDPVSISGTCSIWFWPTGTPQITPGVGPMVDMIGCRH